MATARRIDWGLRSYGVPPVIWGGNDKCEHDWRATVRKASHYTGKKKWQHIGSQATELGVKVREFAPEAWGHPAIDAGKLCKQCGAWLGCLGLEPTFQLYVEHLVSVFSEVRRVLRGDGTLWLNLGDCYHNGDKGGYRAGRISPRSIQAGHMAGDIAGAPHRLCSLHKSPQDRPGNPFKQARPYNSMRLIRTNCITSPSDGLRYVIRHRSSIWQVPSL